MQFNAAHQSEFALFLQIQAYLRVVPRESHHQLLLAFVVEDPVARSLRPRGDFDALQLRVDAIRSGRLFGELADFWNSQRRAREATEPANLAVVERSRHADLSLQTLYDSAFRLRFAGHLGEAGGRGDRRSRAEMEEIFYDLELLSKEPTLALHLFPAVYAWGVAMGRREERRAARRCC